MTPDEQRLIENLFDRLARQRAPAKDRQADALIQRLMRDEPDAAYMLVQTALVYEHQLQEASARISSLEAEFGGANLESDRDGSFLSGRIGGAAENRNAPRGGSTGWRDTTSTRTSASAPWSSNPPPASPPAPVRGSVPSTGGGGGFFRSAMATAAGVAGGLLAADGLRNLFGGGASHADEAKQDGSAAADANQVPDEHKEEQTAHDDTDQDWGGDDSFDTGIDI